jgi:antitoxin ParD1/3/4
MPTMNISLPESLKSFVDQRVTERGHSTHSEYVRDLVRKDELDAAHARLKSLLADGLASPIGCPWTELRDELLTRAQQHKPQ